MARISARVDRSIIETGSSATSRSGDRISVRAVAARWRCPPDSMCGYRPMKSETGVSLTAARACSTSSSRSCRLLPMPWISSGSSSTSRILNRGFIEA